MLVPNLFYFFYFAGLASFGPFLNLYFEQELGLPGHSIGLLAGVSPLVAVLVGPVWMGLADMTGRHRSLLQCIMVASVVVATIFWWGKPPLLWLLFWYSLWGALRAPIVPLLDRTVMEMLGERRGRYGRHRVWGTISWGLFGPLAGWLIGKTGFNASFFLYTAMMLWMAVVAGRLPQIGQAAGTSGYWRGVGVLARDRRWWIFLAVSLLGGLGLTCAGTYWFLYLQQIGATKAQMGIALSVAITLEIPVMLFSSWLLRRWRPKHLLALSLIALIVRLTLYSFIHTPWLAICFESMHGLAFGLFWVSGVSYAHRIAPAGLSATAQGLFSAVSMGLGAAIGATAGGPIYEHFGPHMLYRATAILLATGCALLLLATRLNRKPAQNQI